ncbi:hypothetical protein TWF751_000970 [Orbilia oligospora]|nr:hypothetical protein TWF751_000970 [Orbilia oligospora]KAF3248617.1 hypothetical protein TWF128_008333 [Orbilia oligospora]
MRADSYRNCKFHTRERYSKWEFGARRDNNRITHRPSYSAAGAGKSTPYIAILATFGCWHRWLVLGARRWLRTRS